MVHHHPYTYSSERLSASVSFSYDRATLQLRFKEDDSEDDFDDLVASLSQLPQLERQSSFSVLEESVQSSVKELTK